MWTIIPFKPLNEGKSRLAGNISPRQRRALHRELLTRTLTAISQAHLSLTPKSSSSAATATRWPKKVSRARPRRLNDAESEPKLNAVLTQAARYAATHGGTKVLVLPTDLLDLTAGDVRTMASPRGRDPQITVAPNHEGGTNASMLQLAQAIPFAFSRDSFQCRQRLAIRQMKPAMWTCPNR